MKDYSEVTSFLKTQVLIIGGGIAGLTAAVSLKETHPDTDVMLIDKACASKGYAGKAGRTTGLLSFVTAEDKAEDFLEYCVKEIGFYLNDQELMLEMAQKSRSIVEKLVEWGVDIVKNEDGSIQYAKWPTPWGTTGVSPDMCITLAKLAKKYGVVFQDYTAAYTLLKEDDRIRGAVCFHVKTGEVYAIKADTVILAAGDQNYLITTGWCATGNGIYMAYQAGAEMRNVEFCSMCDFARSSEDGNIYYGGHGGAHIAHDYLHTDKENISQKYRPGFHSSIDPVAIYAWYKETKAGNGPVFVDLEGYANREGVLFKWHPVATHRRSIMNSKTNWPKNRKFQVVPGFIGEVSCVKVDHEMRTTVKGLFAVGDTCGSGSARGGAAPTPPGKIHGTGILNALFTAMKAAEGALNYLKEESLPDYLPSQDLVNDVIAEAYAPLYREEGMDTRTALDQIQDIVATVDYSIIRTEDRMTKALEETLHFKKELENLKAADYHDVLRCFDLKSMALCSEMFYRTALMRTETRGFCFREDYPDQDDQNWLKWIVVKKENDQMRLFTEEIPFERYMFKPES